MRTYAFLILLLCSISSISQNCDNTLSGTVTDLHDGSLLVGAILIVAGSEKAVQTDINGKFTISNLCNDTYSIQVSHPYCLAKGFTVKIAGNTTKNFKLEHHLEELNQVTVEGKAFSNKSKTILENTISKEELERFSSGTLGDALNSLSGVSSLNTGNTVIKPLINGLHSSRVVIINNGVRMEDQEWGAEHAPNVDINSVGNLTLIKGAGALQYSGDALGGVIIAEASKVPVKDSLYGKTLFTAASNGRGSSITSQLTKSYQSGWYGTVQGTLKRFGDFEAPDYVLSNTGIFERNASLLFGFNHFDYGIEGYYSFFKNEIGILRASHLGGAQDQIRAINSDRPLIINDFTYDIDAPKQDVTHHLARIKGFKRFDSFGKLSLQYDFQRNNRLEFDIRRGDDRDKASLDLELDTHTLLLDLDSDLTDEINLKTGLMARYQNNFADPNTGVRRLIPDYDKYDLGIYAIADYRWNDNLLLEAGGRFDYTYMDAFKFYRTSFWESRNYDELFPEIVVEELANQILTNPQLNFYNASATLGATYDFDDEYKLFFNYSLASRAPNPSELFSEGLHHSASRIELGDLRFNSEIGHKIALTFQRDNDVFGFSINPYINTINDFIIIEPTEIQQTVRGNFQVWEYRQTNAQLLGVDVDASYAFAKAFRFNHQFSFIKGYDRTRDEPLISIPAINTKNEVVYQNPDLKNLRLALQSEYVFRQNEFPDNNFEVFIPQTETMETVDVSTPPDAYHLLNFNSSIDFNINKKSKLTVGFSVANLFDTSYRNYLNRLRYYADDLGRNFLLNLKINY
ncbi:TonB-dependent receptor [Subsaximicrobium wynnwilliamsii]|uniref:TonB-dependent receptor n=1 Tax=Subsaximicrobium wynnwilliamsii TaxID=291179 RepID=A0A5C6ZJR1_9FLAO|nr:TonB-dependent receptor [Subsaximicrobium wynnwilliamsii]TXD84514.1 TonB-dependent receptor [Subsaximicrobium wynnwilliamsii]TXD90196.1 TonB-dependent receptor [Subsaximicrobium wynnwilliamsii]TXE04247.1 TonB-dependent receptor [Subsaximicrobium wynnwilliamsii]